jgi:hypothetical protein
MGKKKPMTVAEAGQRGGQAKNAKLTEEQRKEATAKARARLAEVRAAARLNGKKGGVKQ